jgi:hypothetical protein
MSSSCNLFDRHREARPFIDRTSLVITMAGGLLQVPAATVIVAQATEAFEYAAKLSCASLAAPPGQEEFSHSISVGVKYEGKAS